MLVSSKLSLITENESQISSRVTVAEAREFLQEEMIQPAKKKVVKKDQDDDLLDEIE
jgi:hypothetical protein